MRLGVFAKTFAGADPRGVLDAVAAAGFSAAQYNMACSGLASMPDAVPVGAVDFVHAAAAASGVAIVAVSATFNMIHPDLNVRADGLRRLEALASAGLPGGLLTLCTGTRDPSDMWRAHPDNASPGAWADLLASMHAAIAIAERHGTDLGIEPELANVVDSAAKARRLIDELASARVKIVLDPANLFEREALPRQRDIVSHAIDLLGDRIIMAHAKDRAPDGGFVAAGQGVLDYPHFLARLKACGFGGALVTHGLSAAQAPGVATFLRAKLAGAGIAGA